MTALLIRYARCSTDQQDLTAQRDGLVALGVAGNRIYVDHGLTGPNRERPGLREALAACPDTIERLLGPSVHNGLSADIAVKPVHALARPRINGPRGPRRGPLQVERDAE